MEKYELRRQKLLRSRSKELWIEEGINQVFLCFELVGVNAIFKEYENKRGLSFEEFYEEKVSENKFCYRNMGVLVIFDIIEKMRKDDKLPEVKYYISKTSMKRYGINFKRSFVRVYESSAVVLKILLDHIMADENMAAVYNKSIKMNTMLEYFDFQAKCLDEDKGGLITHKKRVFIGVGNDLAELIGDKANAVL